MTIVDTMAQRYHLLPTEVLSRATTFDLEVMFVSQDFQHRRSQQQENAQGDKPRPKLSQDQMQAMLDRARSRKRK